MKCFFNSLVFLSIGLPFLTSPFVSSMEVRPLVPTVSGHQGEIHSVETKFFPDLNLTQLILKNGMTVWLKPTNFESNEIFVKVSSLGGVASLAPSERPSGILAAQISWESGLGPLSADRVSVLMYEHSFDFITRIFPFSRSIEGDSTKEGLDVFLQCINMVFTEHKLNRTGFKETLKYAEEALRQNVYDSDYTYEHAFLKFNTQNLSYLHPLTVEGLKHADLNVAKSFFDKSFTNPSSFCCVIVGSFDLENVKHLIDKHLATIPTDKENVLAEQIFKTTFPKGKTHKVVDLIGRTDCLTRISFPLLPQLNEANIPSMELMCQIIEAKLRSAITARMNGSHGVDVSYEFPLYPLLESPWISIRFRSEKKQVELVKEIILRELKVLQEGGASEKEMLEIKRLQTGSDEFWLRDNFYWASMLSNYYLWKWSPDQILEGEKTVRSLKLETINEMLKSYFSLTNYSVIVGVPAEKK